MSFDEWVSSSDAAQVRLKIGPARAGEERVAGADALLYAPLIAFTLLVAARHLRGQLRTAEISAWTAAVLSERTFGARESFKRFAWSLALRSRCSEALEFLESTGFCEIHRDDLDRHIRLTKRGAAFLASARKDAGSGQLYDDLRRACAAAEARGITLL